MVLHHLDTISRRSKTVDITIYGILEQNRTNNAAFLVGRICHDFSSQVMYHAHHLGIILVVLVRDTICGQSFRAGATTLVEGRNETSILGHLLQLFFLYCVSTHLAAAIPCFRGRINGVKGSAQRLCELFIRLRDM